VCCEFRDEKKCFAFVPDFQLNIKSIFLLVESSSNSNNPYDDSMERVRVKVMTTMRHLQESKEVLRKTTMSEK
jgi:hypothetical protein